MLLSHKHERSLWCGWTYAYTRPLYLQCDSCMIVVHMLLYACAIGVFQLLPIPHGVRSGIVMASYNASLSPLAASPLTLQMCGRNGDEDLNNTAWHPGCQKNLKSAKSAHCCTV